jgi:hypothetical protein
MFVETKLKLIACLLSALVLFGCGTPAKQPEKFATAQVSTPAQTRPDASDSVYEPAGDFGKHSESLLLAWRSFTASGQYRIARKGETADSPYAYSWGDLNYPKRVEDDHFAAIIVDTTKSDANRFGLVIFSPPAGGSGYEAHWLYRDRDLSKASVHRASGDLYFTERVDDGSEKTCSVSWNRRLKRFECK